MTYLGLPRCRPDLAQYSNIGVGIDVAPGRAIGLGDAIQFSSLPENYFRHTGKKLIDPGRHWVFDYNPYILRSERAPDVQMNLWERLCLEKREKYKDRFYYLSNAEICASFLDCPVVLNRPRLYRFEDFPFKDRTKILLQVRGNSHGQMPEHIVRHVVEKYKHCDLWRIGHADEWNYPFASPPHIVTPKLWDLVKVISEARMTITVDSGPSWIAQCYPDIVVKKVRLIPTYENLENWEPLACHNFNSYWDDRSGMIFNTGDDDRGFTWSYKRI